MRKRAPEHGILMSAPMVLALLREVREPGAGKTETRRIVNPQPGDDLDNSGNTESVIDMETGTEIWPRYRVGDRLWVKETHAYVGTCDPGLLIWRADYPACVPSHYENVPQDPREVKWSPSLLMPRRASRITMKCQEVVLERLQDITERAALAEGIEKVWGIVDASYAGGVHREHYDWRYFIPEDDEPFESALDAYEALWRRLHTKPGERWDDNPYVWVYRFSDLKMENPRG